ncbi:hypothetical protein D1AOALGA4SA_4421 [Olavius algarvensis Delta 1 endosymbiont]|nr:hypothetical protein D1AOALGA4SA_4421 [Olavius algarvensis Delta 1 endosymbiont]
MAGIAGVEGWQADISAADKFVLTNSAILKIVKKDRPSED